jgi:hypothetical protein
LLNSLASRQATNLLISPLPGRLHRISGAAGLLFAFPATPSRQQAIAPECVTLVLRSIETSAGICRQGLRGDSRSLARDCDCLSHAELCKWLSAPKQALPRKKTRWLLWLEDTSNGRVSPCSSSSSNPISHADYSFQGANGTAASIRAPLTPLEEGTS